MKPADHGGVDGDRIRRLNRRPTNGGAYVLYWMQQSVRVEYNHALAYASHASRSLGVPLLVYFGLTDSYPEASLRHYRFLLEGLVETGRKLRDRGAGFVVRKGEPPEGAVELSEAACLCVLDRGYLDIQRRWRDGFAERVSCAVVEVETDVIVPVEVVSNKEEYAASTIRKKIYRELPRYLSPVPETEPAPGGSGLDLETLPTGEVGCLEANLEVDDAPAPVDWIHGGYDEAAWRLTGFIRDRLPDYAELRNEPSLDYQSDMSPYLHFGQISPLEIASAVLADEEAQDRTPLVDGEWVPGRLSESAQAYLEELIVRRELSMNFVRFSPRYADPECLPDWAKRTIAEHAEDERPVLYTPEELESAATHDEYWNAAQREMVSTGKMHGYMRMYWGKKIIEWTADATESYRRMVALDNRYFLDGRDPNGYAGVAWCFGKHDRPWQERSIFGKLRYMNARGLERKFDIAEYVRKVDRRTEGDGETEHRT